MFSTIAFAVLSLGGIGFFTWNVLKIRQNILLGRDLNRSENSSERWKTMILVSF
jgi:hypothetical protein